MRATWHDHNLRNTLLAVEYMATKYFTDLKDFKNYTPREFFTFVSKVVKYQPDPVGIERVVRPKLTLKFGFGDCDDKTVLQLAFYILKNITCGYSLVSEKEEKEYHHIFAFMIVGNKKIDTDATYKSGVFGKTKKWIRRKDFILYIRKPSVL